MARLPLLVVVRLSAASALRLSPLVRRVSVASPLGSSPSTKKTSKKDPKVVPLLGVGGPRLPPPTTQTPPLLSSRRSFGTMIVPSSDFPSTSDDEETPGGSPSITISSSSSDHRRGCRFCAYVAELTEENDDGGPSPSESDSGEGERGQEGLGAVGTGGMRMTVRMPDPGEDVERHLREKDRDDGGGDDGGGGGGGANDGGPLPETVLRYERQMRKIRASDRAGAPVTASEHLRVVHLDDHIVVTDKPSGVLCVPGVNDNPSLLNLVYDAYEQEGRVRDSMIAHRLDMDTSGLVVFARTAEALRGLHASFRDRKVAKVYEALLCGHVKDGVMGGVIDLALQRDHRHPPFMRVATPESEAEAARVVKDLRNNGYKKIMRKKPKKSVTEFKVLGREMYAGVHPATRVALHPITGRTHQLRVHCAAIGHPIIADPAYGVWGEASPNGGFPESVLEEVAPSCASLSLQKDINETVQKEGQTMCLHARRLGFSHPITGEEMDLEAEPPF